MPTAIESLLGLKVWKEDEAKNLFAVALKEVAIEEDHLKNLEDALFRVEDQFHKFRDSGVDIEAIKRASEYQSSIIEQIARQKEKILQKEKTAEKVRLELLEATKERKVFERLHEKQVEAQAAKLLSIEQRQSDESATARFKYSDED